MPLTGMPILSTSVASSFGGMRERIPGLDASNCLALSSTRVPTGQAHMQEDLAAVDRGEKIAPQVGRQQKVAPTMAQKSDCEDRAPAHRQVEDGAIAFADASKAASKLRWKMTIGFREALRARSAACGGCGRSR